MPPTKNDIIVSEVVLASAALAFIGFTRHALPGAATLIPPLETFIRLWAHTISLAAGAVYTEEEENNLDLLVTREALWSICLSLVEFKAQPAGVQEKRSVDSLVRQLAELFEHGESTQISPFEEAKEYLRDGFPEQLQRASSSDDPALTPQT